VADHLIGHFVDQVLTATLDEDVGVIVGGADGG
jgi:hypothetical protein